MKNLALSLTVISKYWHGRKSNFLSVCLLLMMLAAFVSGCVSEQYSEFRGTVARGTTATNPPSIIPIGRDYQRLDPKFADAMTGFGLAQGDIFFIHDRRKYVAGNYRLANDAVSAVYFSEARTVPEMETAFLGEDAATRDKTEGIHRLQGSFDVEKWKSNVDFRIHLAMQSSETNPWVVNGVLTTYNRWEFRPLQAIALTLGSLGLAGE